MKRFIVSGIMLAAVLAVPVAVLAHNGSDDDHATPSPTVTASDDKTTTVEKFEFKTGNLSSNLPAATPKPVKVAASKQAARMANLKTKGAAEINRRLDSLKDAQEKLAASTTLSQADKSALNTQLSQEIDGLTALSSKQAAATTLDAARTSTQAVTDNFRVYALMLPKVRLINLAGQYDALGANFDSLITKLETRITAAKAAGKDVTAAATSLASLKAHVASAKAKYSGIADKVMTLTPADYNANRNILAGYRDALVLARADFKAARDDVRQIRKALGDKDSSSTASASPSASPSATPAS